MLGVAARALPVACAFHSPFLETAASRFSKALRRAAIGAPDCAAYSNTSAEAHPADAAAIVATLEKHLALAGAVVAADCAHVRRRRTRVFGSRTWSHFGASGGEDPAGSLGCDDPLVRRQVRRSHRRVPRGRWPPWPCAAGLSNGSELFRGRLIQAARNWGRLTRSGAFRRRRVTQGPRSAASYTRAFENWPPPTATWAFQPLRDTFASWIQRALMPATPATPAWQAPADDDGVDRVMIEYTRMMGQFVATQAEPMARFVGSEGSDCSAAPSPPQPVYRSQSQPALPRPRPQAPPAPVSAPVVQASAPAPVAAAPAPTIQRSILDELLAIASERTGYPADMLDVTASLEADLGVDSIKRVEIIGAFQKTRSDAERAKISSSMETLSAAGTLRRSRGHT